MYTQGLDKGRFLGRAGTIVIGDLYQTWSRSAMNIRTLSRIRKPLDFKTIDTKLSHHACFTCEVNGFVLYIVGRALLPRLVR